MMSNQNDRYAFPKSHPPRRAVGGKPRRRLRPTLDVLEERTVMSNAPIVVNSLADVLNPAPGTVTLRSAIQQANTQGGGNVIALSVTGTYQISLAGAGTGTNNSGAFAILPSSGGLTIQNTSGGPVAIDGGRLDRVFDINPAADQQSRLPVEIDGVAIQNGLTSSADATAGSGGGIRVQGNSDLTLNFDTLQSNQAGANGGGIGFVGTGFGVLLANSTQFKKNVAAGDGGALYTSNAPGSTVSVANALIQNNTARNGGGVEDPGTTSLSLNQVTFDGNRAVPAVGSNAGGDGGALDLSNPTRSTNTITSRVYYSLFLNNQAFSGVSPPAGGSAAGGAINHSAGTLIAYGDQFNNNQAAGAGGAVATSGPVLSIDSSTFLYNQSGARLVVGSPNASTPGDGGAVAFSGPGTNPSGVISEEILNSTFYRNAATGRGGAASDAGPGDLAFVNNTVNENSAAQDGGGLALLGTTGTLQVQNSILYNNTSTATGPDVATLNGSAVSDLGGNLVRTPSDGNLGFTGATLKSDPMLGPITDNGGAQPGFINQQNLLTEALALNSPAAAGGVSSRYYTAQDELSHTRSPNSTTSIGAFQPQFKTPPSLPFAIGTDGQAYYQNFGSDGLQRPLGDYVATNSGAVTAVAATRFGVGAMNFELFAIGAGGQVKFETINPRGQQSGYAPAATGAIKSISTGTDASGNPLLFAIDNNNQLYEQRFDANGQPLSASYIKPAFGDFALTFVAHNSSGTPVLYVSGFDGQVYYLPLDAAGLPVGSNGGTATVPLHKLSYGPVHQLIVSHEANGTPEIFVRGTDDYIYYHKLDPDGGTSSIGNYIGGKIGPVKSLSVTNDSAGNPELFAVGLDNSTSNVYGQKVDANGDLLGSLFHVGSVAPGGASEIYAGLGNDPGNPTTNYPLIFALAGDNQVYTQQLDASGDAPSVPTKPFTLLGKGGAFVSKVTLSVV